MKTALEKLSKEDLLKGVSNRDEKKAFLSNDHGEKEEKIDFFTLEREKMLQRSNKRSLSGILNICANVLTINGLQNFQHTFQSKK